MDTTGITLATWAYLLHRSGVDAADPAVVAACAAIDAGGEAGPLAAALTSAVRAHVRGEGFDAVVAGLGAMYGAAVSEDVVEGDPAAHLAALRRRSFGDSRPWLAAIADRVDGALVERLVMVERFGHEVVLMDPNPWDDVEEERSLSLLEFQVRWELAGARSIRAART